MSILKEPLLHFLLAGAVLFALFNALNPKQLDERTLIVDEQALLTFIQFRSKSFEKDLAKQRWLALKQDEKKQLVDDYIREELLYREAQRMQLERDDYIIKRRMAQKMQFILQPPLLATSQIDEAKLQAYFDSNSDLYEARGHATFTHVYFANGSKTQEELLALRNKLNKEKVVFSDAINFGERFLYHLNYVERTQDYVQSQLGVQVANGVFSGGKKQLQEWLGPFSSEHGQHLIFVTAVQDNTVPPMQAIRGRVVHDFQLEQQKHQFEQALEKLRASYTINQADNLL